MSMTDIPQYKSTLTGTEIDAAMKKMAENEIGDFVLKSALLDLVYPVGSVYISYNSASPAALFGGTWEQIQGRFLLASSESYPAGSTGGEVTVTLTENQIPSHTHAIGKNGEMFFYIGGSAGEVTAGFGVGQMWENLNKGRASTTSITGGGQSHNNMPPYLAVYMWQRTA